MKFEQYLTEALQLKTNTNEIHFEKNEVIAFADQFSKAVRFAIICAWDNSYNGRVSGMIGNLLDAEFKRDIVQLNKSATMFNLTNN